MVPLASKAELQLVVETINRNQDALKSLKRDVQGLGEAAQRTTRQANPITGWLADIKKLGTTEGALGALKSGAIAGAGFLGLTAGLGGVVEAGRSAIDVLVETQRVERATAAAYKSDAGQFTSWAGQLSTATGYSKNAILEAALSAKTLSANYGLTIQQTQDLIKASTDLANVRGIGVAEAFERVQSAIRGEAEASEYLGLVLNDTYMKNQANNGAYRQTWETLTDTQKAQLRYAELLRQANTYQGLAEQGARSLQGQFNRLDNASLELGNQLGKVLEPSMIAVTRAATGMVEGGAEVIKWLRGEDAAARDAADAHMKLQLARDGSTKQALDLRSPQQQQFDQGQFNAKEWADKQMGAQAAKLPTTFVSDVNLAAKATSALEREQYRLNLLQNAQSRIGIEFAKQLLPLQMQRIELDNRSADARANLLAIEQRIRDVTREDLGLRRQVLQAQLGALGPNAALQDNQTAIRRLQLLAQMREIGRGDARRQIRALMQEQPRLELAALDANQAVNVAQRASQYDELKRQLAGINLQLDPQYVKLQQITQEHDLAAAALDRQISKVELLQDAYNLLLAPEILDARKRLLDYEVQSAQLQSDLANQAAGGGAGTRAMREGGILPTSAPPAPNVSINIGTVNASDPADVERFMQLLADGYAAAKGSASPTLPGAQR